MANRKRYFRERDVVVALVLAIVLVWIAACAIVGAADDTQTQLWIYTEPEHCEPCRRLDRDIAAGKLPGFRIKRLAPVAGYSKPCIYYRDRGNKWRHYLGWGADSDVKFMAQWKADTKR